MFKATPNGAKKLESVAFDAPPENQDPKLADGYGD